MKLLFKENYLAFIKNSDKTKAFANVWAMVGKQRKDLTQGGKLSCAYFVSSVLKIFGLIKEVHLTVSGTLNDMQKSGWFEIKDTKAGAVLLWEKKRGHYHLGFYLGKNLAISNNSKTKDIRKHHFTYQGKRKIIKIFWHNKLDEEKNRNKK